ncbi:lipopolysaccharide assembly protein LapA domain-containing protein [Mumia sp. DW29H23]|uniref:lipopolysaccharide assembly protein LapA domain-containing protein n=1 Tax=Mumia sp. DW29H23 TaxID=3421241 RepID=UPI003D68D55C
MTATPPPGRPGPGDKAVAFLKQRWLPLVLLVVAIVFVVQNRDGTTISFLFLEWSSPLWFTLALVLLVGVAIGWALKGRRGKP